jgi:hypothetical protein
MERLQSWIISKKVDPVEGDLRDPKNFRRMFEKMGQCCAVQDIVKDCSSMPNGMMKKMMDMFCPTDPTDFKDEANQQKDHEE